jgi:carbonic anhydrase
MIRLWKLIAVLSVGLASVCAEELPAHEIMRTCLNDLIKDNHHFVSNHPQSHFAAFKDSQSPRATLVLCSDSRVQDRAFSQSPENDFFVIRKCS